MFYYMFKTSSVIIRNYRYYKVILKCPFLPQIDVNLTIKGYVNPLVALKEMSTVNVILTSDN